MVYPTAKTLQEEFLLEMMQNVFPNSRNSAGQKLCGWYRFHPENVDEGHGAIARLINQQLNDGFNRDSINATISEVVKKIAKQFATEMEADAVNLDLLKPNNPGSPEISPWKICYDWLWDKSFPRWVFSKVRQQPEMTVQPGWLEFITPEDAQKIGGTPKEPPQVLQQNLDYWLQVKVPVPGTLLLLNKSYSNTYCLCPCVGMSKTYEISKPVELMPHPEAELASVYFEHLGTEEFIAIWLEEGWPFADLGKEILPQLNRDRAQQIWDGLQGKQWQGFHRQIQVTSL
ncbi:hypothetical protein [Roseofilum casamattae]|uniref:Uncharacterized protein n=1 Tax=Roseofilum casamattae BLCC-M143 TaxID=3022442 RepID=A0ABT7C3C7_9CYAN|nr:hypothetical protein [Roseofilum casamattae]MDJ1185254.1 hypothetical protein [Roseofilum casamattae BLCC-M143]